MQDEDVIDHVSNFSQSLSDNEDFEHYNSPLEFDNVPQTKELKRRKDKIVQKLSFKI